MTRYAVISYTRSTIGWAVLEWSRKNGESNIAKAARDLRKQIDLTAQVCSFEGENDDPAQIVDYAISEISDLCGRNTPDRLCITGFGPFVFACADGASFGEISTLADKPFTGYDIREHVVAHFGQKALVDVVTDVEALALDAFWREIEARNALTLDQLGRIRPVVSSFIVARGIGGAIVHSPGTILRGRHHAEMGHIPVAVHPDDPLQKSACDLHPRGECATARASIIAAAGRAVAMDLNFRDMFEDKGKKNGAAWKLFWEIEAYYLAQLCVAAIYSASPTHIVMAGTLIENAPFLIPMIRAQAESYLKGGKASNDPYAKLMEGAFVKPANRYDAQIHGAMMRLLGRELTYSS